MVRIRYVTRFKAVTDLIIGCRLWVGSTLLALSWQIASNPPSISSPRILFPRRPMYSRCTVPGLRLRWHWKQR